MTCFIFHAFRADGAPVSLDAVVLPSPQRALAHAAVVMKAHDSAARITIWQGDLEVGRLERAGPEDQDLGAARSIASARRRSSAACSRSRVLSFS